MEAIVAVYSDWGIGRDGTQPVALRADRSFFRKTTAGAAVLCGRRTAEDFPGGKPLPNRVNYLLTRRGQAPAGFLPVRSVEEALEAARGRERFFVIGGASVYRAMIPYCSRVYVTKLEIDPGSDVFFPDLDSSPDWALRSASPRQEEDDVPYTFCVYERKK